MDHESLQADQVPDRYLMGKLSEEERLAFEDHFLDCSTCTDYLESVEGLRTGLKALSPRTAAAAPRRGARVHLFRDPRALGLLAAACLVLGVAPAVHYLGELRRARSELAGARRELDDARRETGTLARALENERSARPAAGSAPLAASVFTLNLTRGAATDAPANRIVIRDPGEWAILLLDRPHPKGVQSYRATISTGEGRLVAGPLPASVASGDMLAVGVAPGALRPGDYVLRLEGLGSGGARELATYGFRAGVAK